MVMSGWQLAAENLVPRGSVQLWLVQLKERAAPARVVGDVVGDVLVVEGVWWWCLRCCFGGDAERAGVVEGVSVRWRRNAAGELSAEVGGTRRATRKRRFEHIQGGVRKDERKSKG